MYTIYADGALIYAPTMAGRNYVVTGPELTQQLNKADTLTFTVPPGAHGYSAVKPLQTSVTLRRDGEILFHGRVLSSKRDFRNNKTVTCEGALAWLQDSIIPPHTHSGTVSSYVLYILGLHNNAVDADRRISPGSISEMDVEDLDPASTPAYDVDAIAQEVINGLWGTGVTRRQRLEAAGYSYEVIQNKVNEMLGGGYTYTPENTQSSSAAETFSVEVSDYRTALKCLTDEWLDENGFTIRTRSEDVNGSVVTYLDLLSKNGVQGGQELRFGENLLELEEYINAEDICTCVIPLGKVTDSEALTIASVNDGKIYLEHTGLSARYGKIYKTVKHSDIDTASALLKAGKNDRKELVKLASSLTIKAVDMSLLNSRTEPFFVGGYTRFRSRPHGYDEWLLCTKIRANLEDASRSVYEFGTPQKALTATLNTN